MTEKRKRREKSQRVVGLEKPRTTEKAQPKELEAPVSREWLNAHFRTNLDQMSPNEVGGLGWTDEEILELEKYIHKWNEILGLRKKFKLRPFKAEVGGNEMDPMKKTRSENGVLYLNRFGPNYMYCPDVFVAHEIGHDVEVKLGDFRNSEEMRTFLNR